MNELKPKEDRLFFHDLINQTHGMILFLSSKSSLDSSEIELLKSEVKLLQNLVQKYFQLEHKNINPIDTVENQSIKIQETVSRLVGIYYLLPEKSLPELEIRGEQQGILDFVNFYRILNNIIKNMGESQSSGGKILIEFSPQGLNITTENSVPKQNDREKHQGLGLESIASLALECQGYFQYEIHGNTWVNQLFIPYKDSNSIKKIAA